MAIRIKTIPNAARGTKKPSSSTAYKPARASDASGQVNKILELEWEALGRKLNKHPAGSETEKLRQQLKEKDEMLKRANQKIAALRNELCSLQEKQRDRKVQQANHGQAGLRNSEKK
jgi:DNA gyrase/topoisomerase IV subunit A